MFLAQYEVLRENGHSPSEAFNETVEEATQSLFPLIGKYGMDYMYDVSIPGLSLALPVRRLTAFSLPSGLLHHRPSRCPRLGPQVPRRQQARVQGALQVGP